MNSSGFDLQGQVALITGAARGIGLAVARDLSSAGVYVIAADIDPEVQAVATSFPSGVGVITDVTSVSNVQSAVDVAINQYGKLDILINNAGAYPRRSFSEMALPEWHEVINVNLTSVFICCQLSAPYLRQSRFGRVINVGSVIPLIGRADLTHYAAAKAGVIGFSRALARELGPDRVTVNVVSLGAIATEGERELFGSKQDELDKEIIALQCLPERLDGPSVAGAFRFLCSAAASHITGQVLHIDGGWVMY